MISLWAFFWLVGGEVTGNQPHQPSGSNTLGSTCLSAAYPSLTANFSHLEGVSVSAKQLKDIVVCIPWWGTRTLLHSYTIVFLDYFSLVSNPLPFIISNCLNPPVGTQGRSWRLSEACSLWSKRRGTQKGFCAQEPHGVLLCIILASQGTSLPSPRKSHPPQLPSWFRSPDKYEWWIRIDRSSWVEGKPRQNGGWADGGLLADGGVHGLTVGLSLVMGGSPWGHCCAPFSFLSGCVPTSAGAGPCPVWAKAMVHNHCSLAALWPWVECWEDKELSRISFQKCLTELWFWSWKGALQVEDGDLLLLLFNIHQVPVICWTTLKKIRGSSN